METDLLIIGGGPAGLNAAYVAALHGVKTIIVDESFSLGGQLRQQTQVLDNLPKQFEQQRGTALAKILIERLKPLDVKVLLKHTMIGVYKDGRIGVSNGEETIPITAKKVLVTTGAAEEATVFPGWTLPGIMTIGAAQILMNRDHVIPGRHALIFGSNTFSLEVAKQLNEAGVKILGIIENGSQLKSSNDVLLQQIKAAHIPIYINSFIVNAAGTGEVEKVVINHDGVEEHFNVDLICIGKGVTPILEPFEILDCKFTYQEALGGWLPQYAKSMETSNPSTYVAGNAAGITSMGAILLTGEIAAVNVIESLGTLGNEQIMEKKACLWKELNRIEENAAHVFDARVTLIKAFHKERNLPLAFFRNELGEVLNG